MPPCLMTPLVKVALATAGGAMVISWIVKEVRRVNAELDARRATVKIRDLERRPTLRRDPVTGEYRL